MITTAPAVLEGSGNTEAVVGPKGAAMEAAVGAVGAVISHVVTIVMSLPR